MYGSRFFPYQTPRGQSVFFDNLDFPFVKKLNISETGIVKLSGFVDSEMIVEDNIIKSVKITYASIQNLGRLK